LWAGNFVIQQVECCRQQIAGLPKFFDAEI
jgi:hypothetical protein